MKILCPWILANLAKESIDNTKNSHPYFFWNWLLLDGHGLFNDSELDHFCVQAPL